jgi:hypothetical protein
VCHSGSQVNAFFFLFCAFFFHQHLFFFKTWPTFSILQGFASIASTVVVVCPLKKEVCVCVCMRARLCASLYVEGHSRCIQLVFLPLDLLSIYFFFFLCDNGHPVLFASSVEARSEVTK